MLHKEGDGVFMIWQHAKFEMLGYDGILTLALNTGKVKTDNTQSLH